LGHFYTITPMNCTTLSYGAIEIKQHIVIENARIVCFLIKAVVPYLSLPNTSAYLLI